MDGSARCAAKQISNFLHMYDEVETTSNTIMYREPQKGDFLFALLQQLECIKIVLQNLLYFETMETPETQKYIP